MNGITGFSNITGGIGYGTSSGNAEFYYNAPLLGGSGKGATVDVTVGASGTITNVDLNNYGSAYEVGDILQVSGVPFRPSGSTTDCALIVGSINDSTGDIIQVIGIGSDQYNGVKKITGVVDSKQVQFSGSADNNFSESGGFIYHVGVSTQVTNILHDRLSGIATVTLHSDIGLRRGDEIVISGANSVYNGCLLYTSPSPRDCT